MSVSLEKQIACVRREIAMRERTYPKWIVGGRMSKAKAVEEMLLMKAVLETLVGLQPKQSEFGDFAPRGGAPELAQIED